MTDKKLKVLEPILLALALNQMDPNVKDRVRELRRETLSIALKQVECYLEKYAFSAEFVLPVAEKKARYIMQVDTKAAMEEIIKNNSIHYNYEKIVSTSQFHIEEEEFLGWSIISATNALLPDYAVSRIQELAAKYYPELYKLCWG